MTGRTAQTFNPPVVEAYSWLEGKDFSQRALINVSQAAPVGPAACAFAGAYGQGH
jgi:chromate transport protein ChrA